jgi:hypothetical protein
MTKRRKPAQTFRDPHGNYADHRPWNRQGEIQGNCFAGKLEHQKQGQGTKHDVASNEKRRSD